VPQAGVAAAVRIVDGCMHMSCVAASFRSCACSRTGCIVASLNGVQMANAVLRNVSDRIVALTGVQTAAPLYIAYRLAALQLGRCFGYI
jgi:hypothetical protein